MPFSRIKTRFRSTLRGQLTFYLFGRTGSHERAKAFLSTAANGTPPRIGQVFKFDASGHFPFPVAFVRIIHIAAISSLALPDIFGSGHRNLPLAAVIEKLIQ